MLQSEDIKIHFAQQLREHRKKLNVTQEQLAQILGMTRASIINMETGRHTPTLVGLYQLCCVFNCSPADLLPNQQHIPLEHTVVEVQIVKTYKRSIFKETPKPN